MFRHFFITLAALSLIGCFHIRAKNKQPACLGSKKPVTQTKSLGSFESVYIENTINVSLHSGYAKPKVILKGAATDLKNVSVTNHNSELKIIVGKGFPKCGNITAIVRGGKLRRFEYHGAGVIKGTKLNTPFLDLIIDNDGSTTLGGNVGLRNLDLKGEGPVTISGINSPHMNLVLGGRTSLDMKGKANIASLIAQDNARVKFYWVNSGKIKIRGYGHSDIELAGIAEEMNVELCDKAHFNGRYLRPKRAWVKTHDHALAEIVANDRLHALASDTSDIHYHYLPEMGTDFLAFNGAVLDMRDLGLPYIQSYDKYNKYLQM